MAKRKIMAVPTAAGVRIDLSTFYDGIDKLVQHYCNAEFGKCIEIMQFLVTTLRSCERNRQIDDAKGQWMTIMRQIDSHVLAVTGDPALIANMGSTLQAWTAERRLYVDMGRGHGGTGDNHAKAKQTPDNAHSAKGKMH